MLTKSTIQNLFDIDFENEYRKRIRKMRCNTAYFDKIEKLLKTVNKGERNKSWSKESKRREWVLQALDKDSARIRDEIEGVLNEINRKLTKTRKDEILLEINIIKKKTDLPNGMQSRILSTPNEIAEYVKGVIEPVININDNREKKLFDNNELYELFNLDGFKDRFLRSTKTLGKSRKNLKGVGESYYKLLPDDLANKIRKKSGVVGCPYCNRNYVGFDDKKGTANKHNNQLDHIYPKEFFPELALSLYNLIPSCSSCNNSKRSDFLNYHPYISRQPSDSVRFSFELTKDYLKKAHNVKDLDDITIIVNERYAQFKLNPQYAIHQNYLKSVAMTYKQYIRGRNEQERKKIKAILIGKGVSKNLASTDDVTLSHLTKEFLNHLEEIDK